MKMEHDPREFSDGQLNIYYTYFWDEGKQEWRLFGVGKKFSIKKINSLFVGSFVEVPGPANVERSNHVERRVFYSGYVRDKKNKEWRKVDTMISSANTSDKFTNKNWGIEGDEFFMSAGGLDQTDKNQFPDKYFLNNNEDILGEPDDPIHIEKIHQIEDSLPFPTITSHEIYKIDDRQKMKLHILIPEKKADRNEVQIFIGNKEGLTIAKKWELKYTFKNIPNGNQEIEIPYPKEKQFCRILVRDANLQIWSFNTYNLST
jgi:hypothetical protein